MIDVVRTTTTTPASVLLVDDSAANLLALSAVLKPLGARLVEARSGREALAAVENESFAVILLDVQMPEMDGFEVARRIRAMDAGRELPILFLTAIHRDDTFVKRGYSVGGADYITKPFDADVVRARVKAFVNLFEQREAVRQAQVALRTQERDEAIRRLVAFERISTAALSTQDLSVFLRELLHVFMSTADAADSATILLREGNDLRVVACVGLNEEVDERYTVPIGESFAGKVAAERRPLDLENAAESRLVRSQWIRSRGTKGLYGVPLLHEGDVIGVAHIGSLRANAFSAPDKRLFGAIVERAAWAVAEHVKRSRLTEVLSAAPAMIGILGAGGVHEFANPAYTEFFGPRAIVGRSLADLGLAESFAPVVERVRATGISETAEEVSLATEAAGDRVLTMTAQPMRNAVGSIDRVLVFAIDVTPQVAVRTERARLLELERAARLEAELASRMKDEFLATVSHELRTPLNAILGWTVTARTKSPPADIERALAIVERNARSQARIIEDVLDMSRVVSGKLRLELKDVVLNDTVDAALDVVRPAAEAKHIEVVRDLGERIVVRADPQRAQQVIWNILANAIKFTPRNGRVQVSLARAADKVSLTVRDNGEGIIPEFLPHLFEPFRQADPSTTRRHAGLGLGLAIVKHIVDAHGGTISAESDGAGKGAAFTVGWPTVASSDAPARASESPPARSAVAPNNVRLAPLKVLVVDDDEDARSLVAHVLAERGAVIAQADSASRAFEELRRFRPDVLVSDVAMPGGDGYGLIRAVRGLPSDDGGKTPAIALTAHVRLADGERAFAAGFQAHLAKPVDLGKLVTMVASLGGIEAEPES